MTVYKIGVGKTEITDERTGLQMAGFSDPTQKTETEVKDIYARAFYIQDEHKTICMVIVDIWACSHYLKQLVISALKTAGYPELTDKNVMICGTHTHAVPGGYSGSKLYDALLPNMKTLPRFAVGHDKTFSMHIVNSIVSAIKSARDTAETGEIYFGHADIEDCGYQRSQTAYDANTKTERANYSGATDKEMTLLKFTRPSVAGQAQPAAIGMLCWYPIHPTSLRQDNKKVSGDSKGYAANTVEFIIKRETSADIVAGFANANCGDVSGNTKIANIRDPDARQDHQREVKDGMLQADAAMNMLAAADLKRVDGPIRFFHKYENFAAIHIVGTQNRTWPPALGISFIAGSSEDSYSRYIDPLTNEPVIVEDIKEGITNTSLKKSPQPVAFYATGLAAKFGIQVPGKTVVKGHGEKPIVYTPMEHQGYIPRNLPLQVFQIGDYGVVGFPGELTTMAGRRLKKTLLEKFRPNNSALKEIILSCYANSYAQYVTTAEEYSKQHYEGASTPFGPHTLAAFEQEYAELDNEDSGIVVPTKIPRGKFLNISYSIEHSDGGVTSKSYFLNSDRIHRVEIPENAYLKKFSCHSDSLGGPLLAEGPLPVRRGETRRIEVKNTAPYVTISEPLKKIVRFHNNTAFDVEFNVAYTTADGVAKTDGPKSPDPNAAQASNVAGVSVDFNLPWDATNVICKASWGTFLHLQGMKAVPGLKVNFRSGEVYSVRFHHDADAKRIHDEGKVVY